MSQTDSLTPTGMRIVMPSRLGVGEPFSIKVKLRGTVREIPCDAEWSTLRPQDPRQLLSVCGRGSPRAPAGHFCFFAC